MHRYGSLININPSGLAVPIILQSADKATIDNFLVWADFLEIH